MKLSHALSFALAINVVTAPAWPAQNDPHSSHHPAAAVATGRASPSTSTQANAKPAAVDASMAQMDRQMAAMQEMHGKMLSAKTPAQRSALMAGQMQTMQDGMTLMNAMSSGDKGGMGGMGDKGGMAAMDGMAAHHQMMEKRMQMMQAMMQMMIDRLPAASVK